MVSKHFSGAFTLCAVLMLLFPLNGLADHKPGHNKGGGGGNPGGGTDDTPVTITFRNGSGDNIGSDGLPYIHGEPGIRALIEADGNLDFAEEGNSERSLGVDFHEPVFASCDVLFGGCSGCRFDPVTSPVFWSGWTLKILFDDKVPGAVAGGFHALNPGDSSVARLWLGGLDLGKGVALLLSMSPHRDVSPVLVTRVDANTWTVQSTALLEAAPDEGFLRSNGKGCQVHEGNFLLPFAMTVTTNP